MAKYAMLNCWSDLNRGDLGIMLATVAEIHRQDKEAEIIGISSFDAKDALYVRAHKILRDYVPKVYPAVFGTLGMFVGGRYRKELPYKLCGMFFENIRFRLAMLMPCKYLNFFMKKSEMQAINAILSCDVCFSKGGSVFTDHSNKRGQIALERVCRFFKLLHKIDCKYYILGQSFGPVSKGRSAKLVNEIINNAEHVYVREKECIKQYPWINLITKNVSFSNDAGFLLEPKEVSPNPINPNNVNIGLTVRDMENDTEDYAEVIKLLITYLTIDRGFKVHIFQQVAMDDEPDNKMAERILSMLSRTVKNSVFYHTGDYLPQELCWLYGQMDVFIGTRLHSTIFAMRSGTPSLGLVYHGTKAQGIFENIGVSELVVKGPLKYEELKEKFDNLYKNREKYKKIIAIGVIKAQNEMREAIGAMVREANGGNINV